MNKNRLEAFSDGVLAIIITIMVLELKIPSGHHWEDLRGLVPIFISYILSFLYLAIYWNNHHHMMHTVKKVTGTLLWANMHLLFWLSLVPFVTGWMGESGFAKQPTVLYGFVLLMAAVAYFVLQRQIISTQGEHSLLAKALGNDLKGKISPILYVIGIVLGFFFPLVAGIIYITVALMWLIPDKRIERSLSED